MLVREGEGVTGIGAAGVVEGVFWGFFFFEKTVWDRLDKKATQPRKTEFQINHKRKPERNDENSKRFLFFFHLRDCPRLSEMRP